jgi:hypothetical protein
MIAEWDAGGQQLLMDLLRPPRRQLAVEKKTASKFPFRWWGANSTLSGRHQLDERPGAAEGAK